MPLHGISHIGLSTLDLDATRTFYERVLGFRLVTIEQIDLEEGGFIRHAFFDCGAGELLGFMEPRRIETIPAEYDTGINRGLSVPDWFYHVAFDAGSVEELHAKFGASPRVSRLRRSSITIGSCRSISRIPTACYSIRRADSRTRRPPGERGPTHYGYLAPTLPYHRFPRLLARIIVQPH